MCSKNQFLKTLLAGIALVLIMHLFPNDLFAQDLNKVSSALTTHTAAAKGIFTKVFGILLLIGGLFTGFKYVSGDPAAKTYALGLFAGIIIYGIVYTVA